MIFEYFFLPHVFQTIIQKYPLHVLLFNIIETQTPTKIFEKNLSSKLD